MDNAKAKRQDAANPLSTIRRVIWYALRIVLIASAVLGLCYGVFTEAMYLSNIYIVVTEGMPLRAEAILRDGSVSELSQYFTEEQILSDAWVCRTPFTRNGRAGSRIRRLRAFRPWRSCSACLSRIWKRMTRRRSLRRSTKRN